MVSAQQHGANRSNAQHSTGPRSEQGKRRSSVNALRHGLSIPLELTHLAKHLPQLQTWLELEGLQPLQARELAVRILDYERNIQHLQVSLKVVGQSGQTIPAAEQDPQTAPHEIGWVDQVALEIYGGRRGPAKQLARLFEQTGKRKTKEDQRRLIRDDRYYRRAVNQLLKSLRSL